MKKCLGFDSTKSGQLRSTFDVLFTELLSFPIYFPGTSFYRCMQARKIVQKTVRDTLAERLSAPRNKHSDLLDIIIEELRAEETSLSENLAVDIVSALLFGSVFTLSGVIAVAFKSLHDNPDVVHALEQKHIISMYKNQIGYEALSEMDTLHRCIKEAIRMHTSAPVLVRKAHTKFRVHTKEGEEYDIPRGHNILVPTALNNKLTHIYSDPHLYDPDWFGPGREEDKVGGKYSFTTFGGGRHVCPGMALAYLQIKVIWSHLLRNFELKLISSFPKADGSKMNQEPKGKVMISYERHQLM
ncbi:unnamed protein product [Triticum turgidum subsp. durum]|uniref:Cytochrome P450 n=1 Tax=Triticum turgidum subsp. durum TaxID=4567 RepID=A0A9R0WWP5_TRITD|nr:unnamed protein product [Triticum turgidum subsp. durum]